MSFSQNWQNKVFQKTFSHMHFSQNKSGRQVRFANTFWGNVGEKIAFGKNVFVCKKNLL